MVRRKKTRAERNRLFDTEENSRYSNQSQLELSAVGVNSNKIITENKYHEKFHKINTIQLIFSFQYGFQEQ